MGRGCPQRVDSRGRVEKQPRRGAVAAARNRRIPGSRRNRPPRRWRHRHRRPNATGVVRCEARGGLIRQRSGDLRERPDDTTTVDRRTGRVAYATRSLSGPTTPPRRQDARRRRGLDATGLFRRWLRTACLLRRRRPSRLRGAQGASGVVGDRRTVGSVARRRVVDREGRRRPGETSVQRGRVRIDVSGPIRRVGLAVSSLRLHAAQPHDRRPEDGRKPEADSHCVGGR